MTNGLPDFFAYRYYSGDVWSFFVLNRSLVQEIVPNAPYCVISITDPDSLPAEIAESSYRCDVLRLSFHDKGDYGQPLRGSVVMEDGEARQILEFIRNQAPEVKTIVCHCEAGVSRSAAVAAALAKILGEDNEHFFANFAPNRWVYKTILDAEASQKDAVIETDL